MRTEEDIKAEIEVLKTLRGTLNAESDAIEKHVVIWMNARAGLKTKEEREIFDIWMKQWANNSHIAALEWTLQNSNPRMVGEKEPREHIPADVMHKIEFYHGMHTHMVCKLKGNLFHYHRDGKKEMYDKTIVELRKYIPGI
jgi:hypothetical protein